MHILLLRSICKPINFCLRFCRCRKIISPSLFLSSLTLCHWMCVRHKVTQMRFYSVRVFNVIQSPSTKWDDLSQPSNETEAKTISQVNNLWQNPKQVFQQHKFIQKIQLTNIPNGTEDVPNRTLIEWTESVLRSSERWPTHYQKLSTSIELLTTWNMIDINLLRALEITTKPNWIIIIYWLLRTINFVRAIA